MVNLLSPRANACRAKEPQACHRTGCMAPVALPQTQTPYADFRLRAAWRNNVFVERF
jgi:hypothetical protein